MATVFLQYPHSPPSIKAGIGPTSSAVTNKIIDTVSSSIQMHPKPTNLVEVVGRLEIGQFDVGGGAHSEVRQLFFLVDFNILKFKNKSIYLYSIPSRTRSL